MHWRTLNCWHQCIFAFSSPLSFFLCVLRCVLCCRLHRRLIYLFYCCARRLNNTPFGSVSSEIEWIVARNVLSLRSAGIMWNGRHNALHITYSPGCWYLGNWSGTAAHFVFDIFLSRFFLLWPQIQNNKWFPFRCWWLNVWYALIFHSTYAHNRFSFSCELITRFQLIEMRENSLMFVQLINEFIVFISFLLRDELQTHFPTRLRLKEEIDGWFSFCLKRNAFLINWKYISQKFLYGCGKMWSKWIECRCFMRYLQMYLTSIVHRFQ